MNLQGLGRMSAWLAIVTVIAVGLVVPSGAWAGPAKVVPVEGAAYDAGAAMADNLKQAAGKRVSLTLSSGKVFTGLIKMVGDHLVHLEKLQGKEYFDALIRIENIEAMEMRFRKIQR